MRWVQWLALLAVAASLAADLPPPLPAPAVTRPPPEELVPPVAQLPQLDALADTVGGATTQKLLGKLKAGGRIGSVVGEPAGAKDRGFTVQAIFTKPDPKVLAELAKAVADGKLLLPVARRFPLAQVSDAHRLAEAGGVGKVLLTF